MIYDPAPPSPAALVFPADWQATCGPMAGAPAWAVGVYKADGTIEIRLDQCAAIVKAQTGRMRNAVDVRTAALAVLTVAHEVGHKAGSHDQNITTAGEDSSEADCLGWLMYRWVAAKLGLKPVTVARLSKWVRPLGEQSCQKIGAGQ